MNMLRTLAHSFGGHNALRMNCKALLYELLRVYRHRAYSKGESHSGSLEAVV